MLTQTGSFVQIPVSTVVMKLAPAHDHIYWDFP